MSDGAKRIAAERQRQLDKEEWTDEHDDAHTGASLAWAAVCYAAPEPVFTVTAFAQGIVYQDPWPWDAKWDKRPHNGNVLRLRQEGPRSDIDYTHKGRIRALEKAGALIAAEIDRLLRVEARSEFCVACDRVISYPPGHCRGINCKANPTRRHQP